MELRIEPQTNGGGGTWYHVVDSEGFIKAVGSLGLCKAVVAGTVDEYLLNKARREQARLEESLRAMHRPLESRLGS